MNVMTQAPLGYGRSVPIGAAVEGRIVEAMQSHGFTASEAKIYVSLLKNQPATGYELAARSGVPRSAIYSVLRRLQSLGLVNAIQDKPARYVPLTPERLFALLESRFGRSLEALKGSIDDLGGAAAEAVTWTVHGYTSVLEQAERLIGEAEESVHGSLWSREGRRLEPSFARAKAAGKDVILFSFTPLPPGLGQVFSYGIAEEKLQAYWAHKIILVCDDKRVLVGGAEETEETRAVVTEEPAIVEMAVSNLVLDITLYGQRTGIETGPVVTRLTRRLAPVEELVEESLVDGAS